MKITGKIKDQTDLKLLEIISRTGYKSILDRPQGEIDLHHAAITELKNRLSHV